MPVCSEPGCPEITTGPRCDTHRKQQQRATRQRYKRQAKGAGWERISRQYRRTHPTCECSDPQCGNCHGTGCTTPSQEVDHIIDRGYFTDLRVAHEQRNLQALCKPCHSSKTAREHGWGGGTPVDN